MPYDLHCLHTPSQDRFAGFCERLWVLLGLDFGQGFAPHPTPFLCLAKEKGEKKGDPGATPYACGFGCPALLESQGRHGMARRLRRRLAVADCPLTFCDARRATRG